jgi:hypothetical protein
MKTALNIIFLTVSLSSSAQVKLTILDSLSRDIVPYAHIINENGDVIGVTNQFGEIAFSSSDVIGIKGQVQHVSYASKSFHVVGKQIEILLEPIALEEIVVSSKGKMEKKEIQEQFIVLSGYFRSYQLEDGVPKYFSDGFVRYYFPTESHKEKLVPVEVLEHRTFQNLKLLDADAMRTFNLKQDSFGPPFLYEISTINKMSKDYKLVKEKDELTTWIVDDMDSIGKVSLNPDSKVTSLDVDINYSDRLKVRNAFGYQMIFERKILSELYNSSSSKMMEMNFDHLNRVSQYRKLRFKHKSEKEYREIEWVHEFYTTEVNYVAVNEVDLSGLIEYSNVKYESKYSESFLEQVENLSLPKLPESMLSKLNGELVIAGIGLNDLSKTLFNSIQP